MFNRCKNLIITNKPKSLETLWIESSEQFKEEKESNPAGIDLLSAVDENGQTLLHLAANSDNPNILDFLISKGAQPHIKDSEGNSATLEIIKSAFRALDENDYKKSSILFAISLYCAVLAEEIELIKILTIIYQVPADKKYKHNNKTTAELASSSEKLQPVFSQLEKIPFPVKYKSEIDLYENTLSFYLWDYKLLQTLFKFIKIRNLKLKSASLLQALEKAVKQKKPKTAKLILQNSASIDSKFPDEFTAFELAMQSNNKKLRRIFLDTKIENKEFYQDGISLSILRFSKENNLSMVKKLLSYKDKEQFFWQNYKDTEDDALHCAVLNKNPQMAKLLIQSDADFTHENKENKTAFKLALESDETEIHDIFLDKTLFPQDAIHTKTGYVLFYAIDNGHHNLVKKILASCTEESHDTWWRENETKKYGIHLAIENNDIEMIKILQEHDSNIHKHIDALNRDLYQFALDEGNSSFLYLFFGEFPPAPDELRDCLQLYILPKLNLIPQNYHEIFFHRVANYYFNLPSVLYKDEKIKYQLSSILFSLAKDYENSNQLKNYCYLHLLGLEDYITPKETNFHAMLELCTQQEEKEFSLFSKKTTYSSVYLSLQSENSEFKPLPEKIKSAIKTQILSDTFLDSLRELLIYYPLLYNEIGDLYSLIGDINNAVKYFKMNFSKPESTLVHYANLYQEHKSSLSVSDSRDWEIRNNFILHCARQCQKDISRSFYSDQAAMLLPVALKRSMLNLKTTAEIFSYCYKKMEIKIAFKIYELISEKKLLTPAKEIDFILYCFLEHPNLNQLRDFDFLNKIINICLESIESSKKVTDQYRNKDIQHIVDSLDDLEQTHKLVAFCLISQLLNGFSVLPQHRVFIEQLPHEQLTTTLFKMISDTSQYSDIEIQRVNHYIDMIKGAEKTHNQTRQNSCSIM